MIKYTVSHLRLLSLFMLMFSVNLWAADGVLMNVNGNVRVNGDIAFNGTDLDRNDYVTAGPASSATVILSDKSILDLGAETMIHLADYTYDADQPENNKTDVNFVIGTLRYISGLMAKADPDSISIQAGTATIGVRGTFLRLFRTANIEKETMDYIFSPIKPLQADTSGLSAGTLTYINTASSISSFYSIGNLNLGNSQQSPDDSTTLEAHIGTATLSRNDAQSTVETGQASTTTQAGTTISKASTDPVAAAVRQIGTGTTEELQGSLDSLTGSELSLVIPAANNNKEQLGVSDSEIQAGLSTVLTTAVTSTNTDGTSTNAAALEAILSVATVTSSSEEQTQTIIDTALNTVPQQTEVIQQALEQSNQITANLEVASPVVKTTTTTTSTTEEVVEEVAEEVIGEEIIVPVVVDIVIDTTPDVDPIPTSPILPSAGVGVGAGSGTDIRTDPGA